MTDFNIEEFKEYIKEHLIGKPQKLTLFINAISQFKKYPHEFFGVTTQSWSVKVIRNLDISGKPISMSVNRWFLYCFSCENIKDLTNFNISKRNSDSYNSTCKKCIKLYKNIEIVNSYKYFYRSKTKLSKEQLLYINKMYRRAKFLRKTGKNVQVDHFIPIILGGSHTPWNLRIITEKENKRKTGKHPKDFYSDKIYKSIVNELNLIKNTLL